MTTQTPSSLERLQHLLPQLFASTSVEGSPFLRAQITSDITIGIPMNCVEEVRLITHDMITPMPNMPASVLGLVQSKGHVFWLLDLAKTIGLNTPLNRSKRHEMIMVRTQELSPNIGISTPQISGQNLFLGFTVQRVKGTLRLQQDDLKMLKADDTSSSNPCLTGPIRKNGELISFLNL